MSVWLLSHRDAEYFARTLREQRRNELREARDAQRLPLTAARYAHELLGKGIVTGKIVLVRNGS